MDVRDAIRGRRSVRRFEPTPVAEGHINELLEAARWAPSAGNLQPWIFVVVTSPDARRELAAAAYGQDFVARAPVVIGVAAAPPPGSRYGERGRNLYCLQDTAAAVQNILLTAHALGLGTCWVGAFDDEATARALRLGPGERPVALIPVGAPAAAPGRPNRKPLEEIVRRLA